MKLLLVGMQHIWKNVLSHVHGIRRQRPHQLVHELMEFRMELMVLVLSLIVLLKVTSAQMTLTIMMTPAGVKRKEKLSGKPCLANQLEWRDRIQIYDHAWLFI